MKSRGASKPSLYSDMKASSINPWTSQPESSLEKIDISVGKLRTSFSLPPPLYSKHCIPWSPALGPHFSLARCAFPRLCRTSHNEFTDQLTPRFTHHTKAHMTQLGKPIQTNWWHRANSDSHIQHSLRQRYEDTSLATKTTTMNSNRRDNESPSKCVKKETSKARFRSITSQIRRKSFNTKCIRTIRPRLYTTTTHTDYCPMAPSTEKKILFSAGYWPATRLETNKKNM